MSEAGLSDGVDRRKALLGLMFAATAGITYARQPRNRIDRVGSNKLEKLIPNKIGQWEFAATSGLVVPPEDPLSDALYSQLLTRVYTDGTNPPVMLLVAQSAGQTGLLQVHRPEFCYPAGGFALSPIVQRPVEGSGHRISVSQLTAEMPGRIEQILYWTRVGDSMPISWTQQRLSIAMDNLRGYVPDAVLVRVSSIDADSVPAFDRLSNFIEGMIAAMAPQHRDILVSNA
jgi:EpsI family protein